MRGLVAAVLVGLGAFLVGCSGDAVSRRGDTVVPTPTATAAILAAATLAATATGVPLVNPTPNATQVANFPTATATSTPGPAAPRLYNSADVLAAWKAHGLPATLLPTGAPPLAGMLETWIVDTPSRVGIGLLSVAPSNASAVAYAQGGHGFSCPRVYVQANIALCLSGTGGDPALYIAALSDLR